MSLVAAAAAAAAAAFFFDFLEFVVGIEADAVPCCPLYADGGEEERNGVCAEAGTVATDAYEPIIACAPFFDAACW